ncbi:Na(+) H(+) antiporter subunit G [Fulvivirga imtechensis AK7]|uniref:Na(+) H(+) antiporter subunit G n=1 Tax=Fulvivirga imtechensis AK7 TaxID=1237149 RepID=L8JSH5_9BACT|nr:monovalent cation/H(+) antiporter subunit G [Fulvivirga imtechensis]ELR70444.1 Na(+) H(+) antiporter subunit G [Fulvivirga imtechensis AK7]
MIREWLVVISLVSGALFMLIASIGLHRLPDVYMRMHATTKAPTLGMFLMLTALCIHFFDLATVIKCVVIMSFIFLTTPVATHMISRAAHLMQVPKWKKTHRDDLEKAQQRNKEASHE